MKRTAEQHCATHSGALPDDHGSESSSSFGADFKKSNGSFMHIVVQKPTVTTFHFCFSE